MIALTVVVTGLVGALSFTFALGLSGAMEGLAYGLLGLAVPVIVSDLPLERLYLGDKLLKPRRLNIVSFVWCTTSGAMVILSGLAVGVTGDPSYLGKGLVLAIAWGAGLRLLVFGAFSLDRPIQALTGVLLQPALLAAASIALLPEPMEATVTSLLVAPPLMMLGPALILTILARKNLGTHDMRILPIFRAFLYSWAEEESGPLEAEIAKVSVVTDLEADELTFTDPGGNCLCQLVAPYVHPGPFRNVGSSPMSTLIREALGNCPALVVHGVSSHEKDLASRGDVEKVIESLKAGINAPPVRVCSPMVRGEARGAKASCQIFGNTALHTLTLSPKSHDDIPDSVMERVRASATRKGLDAVVVDAHNCLDDLDLLNDADSDSLVEAAEIAMDAALASKQEPFNIGFTEVKPAEWGSDDGMGTLGIGALTIQLASGLRYTYLVFDSNNMFKGLRERLLAAVESLGYAGGEVLTSDTHVVNAIGATERGYHPMGETMDQERVVVYVTGLLTEAKPRPAAVLFKRVRVEGVRIIGAHGLEVLREVVSGSFRTFIAIATVAIPAAFVASALAAFIL